MIRDDELRKALQSRRNVIGFTPFWESFATFATGIFYLPAALAEGCAIVRWAMLAIGLLVVAYGIAGMVRRKDVTEELYKEIAAMNIISSSIIALREPGVSDSNRYLLYRDEQWNCWFFPNRHSTANVADDERDILNFLSAEFKVPQGDCSLELRGTESSVKLSTEHNEERHYDYRLYDATVKTMPSAWSAEGEFTVGGHACRFMSIAEMLSNERIKEVNHDVVDMVRKYA